MKLNCSWKLLARAEQSTKVPIARRARRPSSIEHSDLIVTVARSVAHSCCLWGFLGWRCAALQSKLTGSGLHHIAVVRQVDKELCQAALGGCIVAEDVGKGVVTERLRQTLAQGLAGTRIVTKPVFLS